MGMEWDRFNLSTFGRFFVYRAKLLKSTPIVKLIILSTFHTLSIYPVPFVNQVFSIFCIRQLCIYPRMSA